MKLKQVDAYNFEAIAKAAIAGDTKIVTEILSKGMNYREAYLYVERFYHNKKASEFIQSIGKCKCGNVAQKWEPLPICVMCSFEKTISEHIEF